PQQPDPQGNAQINQCVIIGLFKQNGTLRRSKHPTVLIEGLLSKIVIASFVSHSYHTAQECPYQSEQN
ncbi:MAG TPA: hypothetical protein PK230_08725, partial [Chitinophagales bacterium]|nr:hypothetical protein [Chitinophagales bacterium]